MPVAPSDLLAPKGEVTSSLFPGEDATALEERLQGYIDEKSGEPDTAVLAWAYYRVYHAVYVRLTTNPHTVSFEDQGSSSYLLSQIEAVRALRDDYLAQYNASVVEVPTRASKTQSLRADFTW